MTGCLLGIKDERIVCLLQRNLQLIFGSLLLLFYLDMLEPFSNYYLVTLNLTSTTRILNKDHVQSTLS